MPILPGIVPLQVADNCVDSLPVNCGDDGVSSNQTDSSYKIEFPRNVSQLPLAGGAVLSIGANNLKLNSSLNVANILTKNLSILQGLNFDNNLEDLVKSRVVVNNALYDIARKNLKVVDDKNNKRRAPSIYIALFKGEDETVIKDGIFNPDMIRVCEFRYIPVESFSKILGHLVTENNPEFGEVVGVSGRKYQDLKDLAEELADKVNQKTNSINFPNVEIPTFPLIGGNDPDVVDLVLEFFPIINISESALASQNNDPVIGGYYTLLDGKIYLKLPDISGRNSAGEASGIITSESSLWIEILSEASINRIEIDNFKAPPIASLVGDQPIEFPVLSNLEIPIELAENETVKVYLSPIVKNISVDKRRSISTFSNSIELFSVPLLTKPIQNVGNRLATINESSVPSLNDISSYVEKVNSYYSGFSSLSNFEDTDYPYFGQQDAHMFFGEKNRPEIILSGDGKLEQKNDDRYFNLSSYGVLEILNSVRPKFYENVPSQWISATPTQDLSGNYIARFSFTNFNNINLANLGGTIEYAVYVGDTLGQITKVSGPNVKLSDATPAVTRINPSGFTGSTPIVIGDDTIIQITGEDFSNVRQINFVGDTTGTPIVLSVGDGVMSQPTNTSITLDFTSQSLLSKGFTAGQAYTFVVQGSNANLTSQENKLYIVDDANDSRPLPGTSLVQFKEDEIRSVQFGQDPIIGIPLFKNGQSATIDIKSRSKLFQENNEIFAYLAIPSSDATARQKLSSFSFPDKVISITSSVGEIFVPIDIEYEFSTSLFDDFVKSPTSNRRASLSFPGNKYSNYNFSSLQNLDKAYVLFTNRSLPEVVGSSTSISLQAQDHGLLELGGDDGPAFIEPSSVLGMAADIGGDFIISSFAGNPFNIPEDIFNTSLFTPSVIDVYNKINRLAIVVSGVKEKYLRKRYTFKIGGTDISKKMSREPKVLKPGQILFVFDNITPELDGILEITVDKQEKNFGANYTTKGYSGQGTAIINDAPGSLYSIDEETGILTVNSEIKNEILISDPATFLNDTSNLFGFVGIAADETKVLDAVYPNSDSDGLIFDPVASSGEDVYIPFTDIDILTTTNLKLGLDPQDSSKTTTIFAGAKKEKISGLQRSILSIPSGATFPSNRYLTNETKTGVMLFFNVTTEKLAIIKHNVPAVVSIGEENQTPIFLSTGEEIQMSVGKKYKVTVRNTDRDFIIKMDEIVLKPRGRPEPTNQRPGEYVAIVEAPESLLFKEDCFEICASTENATRNRAKNSLGRDFVIDLDEIFQDILTGPMKDKIPDVNGLFEKLRDAPLRFVSFVIDKANIPKDLIKSFCDLSFHLLAELKISLNGFQVLMVPIQVIFCIIDVICSLLNPVKIAKAVIRLFQCLYDLVLLLPMIAIPVMFLQLILHLLELLQCVIDKILFTITAINEIARAINAAAQKPFNFAAIKALEETLSEYLFEIEADLSFLEPILSILAIFLQLLQLVFRFPCTIDPGSGEPDCGVDGTLLAGIVAGIAAPDLSEIDFNVMLPVAQTYSTDEVEGSTTAANIEAVTVGDVIAEEEDEETFLDSMVVDQDTLRGTASGSGDINFNATFAPTFTKSKKKGGKPTEVEFQFKSRALSTTLNSKNIDPNQTVDVPLGFLNKTGGQLKVAANGNIYSPVDGESFLDVSGDFASVKPLILNLEVPIYSTDPVTGVPVQTGTETVTRTFDNIPKMVIMDDEFNVYFIKENGIVFDSDGYVESISADVVNTASASKMKFSKEDVELDTDDDPSTDDGTIQIFDFPQIYFFDMRQAGEQLEQFCSTASINSFPFEDNFNNNNLEDIQDTVQEAQDCFQTYLDSIRSMVSDIRTAQTNGTLPLPEMSVDNFNGFNTTVIDCLNGSVDKICKYVINGLNTSFRVVEDTDETPLEEYTEGDLPDDVLDGFQAIGPAFTGAREYAAGIGNSAQIQSGNIANIEVIPRDSYDEEIIGDLTDKIIVEIVSDDTGTAEFIRNENDSIFTKNGTSYFAKLIATDIGEVKLRARICDRTIQAITFDGLNIEGDVSNETVEVDCVADSVSEITTSSPPLGALVKVDRILSIFFVEATKVDEERGAAGNNADLPITQPQQFGTGLVN